MTPKLINVFATLTKSELRQFRELVQSPLYLRQPKVELLLDFLIKKEIARKPEAWDKNKAWKFIFGKTPYDDQRLRTLMSEFSDAIEDLFCWLELRRNRQMQQVQILRAYRKRHLNSHFEYSLRRYRQQFGTVTDDWFTEYEVQYEEYQYDIHTGRHQAYNLQSISDTFDTAFIIGKLKQACGMLSHQATYKTTYEAGLLPIVLAYVEEKNLVELPLVAVYYYAYQAIATMNDDFFEKLTSILFHQKEQLPITQLRDILILAANYGIKRLNTGNKEYGIIIFNLYKMGIDYNILIENEVISRFTYKNIVAISLKEGQVEAAWDFIHAYKPKLESQYREMDFQYNLAKCHYAKGNYSEAMLLLSNGVFDDISLNIGAKVTLLKIYYETQEWNALEALLEASRVFFYRHQELSDYHRQSYLNLIRFIQLLINRPLENNVARQQFLQEVTVAPLPEKDWLIQQITNYRK